jgi:hypothetical protein
MVLVSSIVRHPPHGEPVLAASSTAWCDDACRVIQHIVYQCPQGHPAHSVRVLVTLPANSVPPQSESHGMVVIADYELGPPMTVTVDVANGIDGANGCRRQKQKPSVTRDSRAIPQPSTNLAQPCLSSMF